MILNIAVSAGAACCCPLRFLLIALILWCGSLSFPFSGHSPRFAARRCRLERASFGAAFFMVDVAWIYRTLVVHGHFGLVQGLFTFLGLTLFLSCS